jgi:peptidoglycan-N-acetylglucosamine deacetylase
LEGLLPELLGDVMAKRIVRLSFDDGPDQTTTPELLDRLRDHGVKATFFAVGRNIDLPDGRAILERTAQEGHRIGNHTYSHVDLTQLSAQEIRQEIERTQLLIGSLDCGIKIFRPPFGFRNALVDQVATDLGYKTVLWTVCANDWKKHYANRRWVSHTMKQIKTQQDCIVLAHDVVPSTVAHVPELIRAVRSLGNAHFDYV